MGFSHLKFLLALILDQKIEVILTHKFGFDFKQSEAQTREARNVKTGKPVQQLLCPGRLVF